LPFIATVKYFYVRSIFPCKKCLVFRTERHKKDYPRITKTAGISRKIIFYVFAGQTTRGARGKPPHRLDPLL
jgi:hypothetical protein